jgi:hypothetical protein
LTLLMPTLRMFWRHSKTRLFQPSFAKIPVVECSLLISR